MSPAMENAPSKPSTAEPIARIQENLLARNERRLLNWICARLPAWVTPDMMTFLAVIASFAIFAGYVLSNYDARWLWLSVAAYFVHWLGDSTDGSLARFRKIERPRYGYFLDHSCDGLATLLLLVGIGLSPYVLLEIALVALAGYLLLSIHAFLSVRVMGEMKLSYLNAGPTELRVLLIALTLAFYYLGPDTRKFVLGLTGFDLFTLACGLVLIWLFIRQTWTMARRLAAEEPPRNEEWRRRA